MMEKLSKSTKIIDTLLKITFWVLILRGIYYCYYYVRFLWFLTTNEGLGSHHIIGFTVDWLSIRSVEGLEYPRDVGIWVNVFELVCSTVLTALYCLAVWVLRHILKPMTLGQPFEKYIAADLKKLGWITLALCAADNLMDIGIVYVYEYSYDISQLLIGGNIAQISFHYEFEPAFALVAVVLFLLSYIFHYGAQLQQLSDETL